MTTSRPDREVVLWGIGHTNADVVRRWRIGLIPGVRLTCVSNGPISTYSGMLPGVLAGQYPRDMMQIDLVAFCAAAGARLIQADVTGLDLEGRRVLFENRSPLPFDVLSIGIGSVPSAEGVDGFSGENTISVKPIATFLDRLRERLPGTAPGTTGTTFRLVVVGGGAGGVEIAFCLPAFVRRTLGDIPLERSLIHAGEQLAAGSLAATNDLVRRRLEVGGVRLILGRPVTRVDRGRLTLADRQVVEADLIIWATGAAAPPILRELGLPVDERGFLLTQPTLQTVADAPIFVVGDSGTIQQSPTPKAGVYAVRHGPIVRKNIARLLDGRPLRPYRSQRDFLKLINTGDGRAIGECLGFTFEGCWCWWLKDWIDRRFMRQFAIGHPAR
jgi:pyridine nucleotide-disulfide oxidoreductase family protein